MAGELGQEPGGKVGVRGVPLSLPLHRGYWHEIETNLSNEECLERLGVLGWKGRKLRRISKTEAYWIHAKGQKIEIILDMAGDKFQRVYRGQFHERAGKTILKGTYSFHPSVRWTIIGTGAGSLVAFFAALPLWLLGSGLARSAFMWGIALAFISVMYLAIAWTLGKRLYREAEQVFSYLYRTLEARDVEPVGSPSSAPETGSS